MFAGFGRDVSRLDVFHLPWVGSLRQSPDLHSPAQLVSIALEVDGLHHSFGHTIALENVSLSVSVGTTCAVVGESGSGKSTLLRTFNRLVEPDAGRVRVNGRDVRAIDAVALRRSIGYVPQSGGLLPHWTVARNIGLVPTLTGMPNPAGAARDAMARVGLSEDIFAQRYPHELSGGQRQRVALARALAGQQKVVLLDEAFGALDAISRAELHEAFERLRSELSFTAVLVTHDLVEAARLADIVVVMRSGRIEQQGSFGELRRAPASPYVQALLAQAERNALAFGDS